MGLDLLWLVLSIVPPPPITIMAAVRISNTSPAGRSAFVAHANPTFLEHPVFFGYEQKFFASHALLGHRISHLSHRPGEVKILEKAWVRGMQVWCAYMTLERTWRPGMDRQKDHRKKSLERTPHIPTANGTNNENERSGS